MSDPQACPPAPRTCVLVLGMHRSGTSAITRMINLIGADLPKHVMKPADSNAAGHWESYALEAIDDELLGEAGSGWFDWRALDLAALPPDRLDYFRDEIKRRLEDDFGDQSLFVLKDPRISRFVPLYLDCLKAMNVSVKIVLMFRHPLEVAASLAARNQYSGSDSILVWLRHCLDAEAASRGLERIVVAYDRLMSDPDAVIARLRALLASATASGSADIEGARASIRRDLRHHANDKVDFGRLEVGRPWAEGVFDALGCLERDPADAVAMAKLDRIDAEFRVGGALHAASLAGAQGAFLRVSAELKRCIDDRDALEYRVRYREQEIAELENQLRQRIKSHLSDLASLKRAPFRGELPRDHRPWRYVRGDRRLAARERRDNFLALMESPLFDPVWYLTKYPDVVATGLTAAQHYLRHGWLEGRWPSPGFDPVVCRQLFPQVRPDENPVFALVALHAPPATART